ncbi:MAG: hypothetical protein JWO05_1176 [Gemmatimonadetes bacterium]|nr:hypothetical protein [Gemmatimonadota bacterium]
MWRWQWQRRRNGVPKQPDPGVFPLVRPEFSRPRAERGVVNATWLGHSTTLLQLGLVNVLLDPMFSERASPVAFAGPKRWVAPPVGIEELPPIDVIVVTHNHYDHFDETSIRALARRHPDAQWVTSLGLAAPLHALGARNVTEMAWWDARAIATPNGNVHVGCTPAQHFSARGLFDRNETLWSGFTLRTAEANVYFAGDTGLHPEFAKIRERFGPFDLLVIPIGAYNPRWFMKVVHMNPDDAMIAYRALADGVAVPMLAVHWGTFKLTDEPMDEPPRLMRELWEKESLPAPALWVLKHGETRALPPR